MFDDALVGKNLPFPTVLMDSWCATTEVMRHFDQTEKVFYGPLKSNRKVDDSLGEIP
jgi:hypothetical protein